MEEYVYCLECNPPKKYKQITSTHLKRAHDITVKEYLKLHPDSNLVPQSVRDKLVAANKAKWGDTDYKERVSKAISDVLSEQWKNGKYSRIKPKVCLVGKIEGHDGYIVDQQCMNWDMIQCQVCNQYFKLLTSTHLEKHGLTFDSYKELFPNAKIISDSVRLKHVELATGRILTFEQKHNCGNGSRGRVQSEEEIENRRKSNILACTDDVRRQISATLQGISYDEWEDFAVGQEYCPKFDEVCRESNREKYDRRCFLCDKDESDEIRRLSVHHVDMRKDQGCDGHEWKLVPLCMSCHIPSHTKTWIARIEYLLNNVWM